MGENPLEVASADFFIAGREFYRWSRF